MGKNIASRKVQKSKSMVHLKNLELFYILEDKGTWD